MRRYLNESSSRLSRQAPKKTPQNHENAELTLTKAWTTIPRSMQTQPQSVGYHVVDCESGYSPIVRVAVCKASQGQG